MIIADKKFLSEIDKKAEALKSAILNSETDIKFTGKAYYVSNKGDDTNDGTSPETAIASLARIHTLPLGEGDAVLFERGGLWRGSLRIAQPGITLSAYGSGIKPRIYGSPKNYAVPTDWEKTELENVWRYKYPFGVDIGHMVCDGGKVHGIKKCIGHYGFTGKLDELKHDLEFYSDRNDKETLYVYSAENPGERFVEIELMLRIGGIRLAASHDAHVDNLCIMYVGAHGISSSCFEHLHITNCEIGYIGGGLHRAAKKEDEKDLRYGNGVEIYGKCKDFVVDNCYIHDCYDAGVTHQRKGAPDYIIVHEDVTYSNNLFERCIYSIEYFCEQTNSDEDIMRHIRMHDNICRYAGGFGWQRNDRVARHIQGGWLGRERKYPAEDFIIENNIFDRSRDCLISVSSVKKEHLPEMRGNTYIQYAGKNYGIKDLPYDHYEPYDEKIEDYIKNYCGEADAIVAIVPENDGACNMLPDCEDLYSSPKGFIL